MTSTPHRMTVRSALGLLALGLAGLTFAAAPHSAASHHRDERLVVRGDATVADRPCESGVCRLGLTGGSFRGTPVGSGAYEGSLTLRLAEAFPNGEGGACAPIRGRIVLGAGSPDRLVLTVSGDSCQDGAGDPTTASFTSLARFTVERGTGAHTGARGSGLATFAEDAADHDRMTLTGRIRR